MKTLGFWLNYQELQQSQHRTAPRSVSWFDASLRAAHSWATRLWTAQTEPLISSETDASGRVWWNVYNPQTGGIIWFDSEIEMMEWLDRYPYI